MPAKRSFTSRPADEIEVVAAQWALTAGERECDAGAQSRFESWLDAKVEHRDAYARALELMGSMDVLCPDADERVREARVYAGRRNAVRGIALSLVAGVALALAAEPARRIGKFGFGNSATYQTRMGEVRDLVLEDGTHLDLDTSSRVIVEFGPWHRKVRLEEGRAQFAVQYEAARPFEVEAGCATLRDIGTRFDVRQEGGELAVAVIEGEVEVRTAGQSDHIDLHRGERVILSTDGGAGHSRLDSIDPTTYGAWREGKFVFEHLPLSRVLRELGRYHAARFVLGDPRMGDLRINGSFPTTDLRAAMNTLGIELPIEVTRSDSGTWYLRWRN
jgi:transmembrane sensor